MTWNAADLRRYYHLAVQWILTVERLTGRWRKWYDSHCGNRRDFYKKMAHKNNRICVCEMNARWLWWNKIPTVGIFVMKKGILMRTLWRSKDTIEKEWETVGRSLEVVRQQSAEHNDNPWLSRSGSMKAVGMVESQSRQKEAQAIINNSHCGNYGVPRRSPWHLLKR